MPTNSYTYSEAKDEALAGLDPTLSGIEIRPSIGRNIEEELTVAKIIEIESQKVIDTYGRTTGANKTVTGEPVSERNLVNNSKNLIGRVGGVKSEINQIEQEVRKEPIEVGLLTRLSNRLDTIARNSADTICASRESIILFAGVKKNLQEKMTDMPTPRSTDVTAPSPFPTTIDDLSIFAIEGVKKTHETVEIFNTAGQILGSFTGNGTAFRCENLQNIKNGRTDIVIRMKNPNTNVYAELKFPGITINSPESPTLTTPNPINITGHPSYLEGNISSSGHTVSLLDETGAPLTPTVIPVMFGSGNKKFRIQIPDTGNGTKRYMIRVSNGTSHIDEFVNVTTNLPDLGEKPDGMQDTIEINEKKQKITLGKIKSGQNMPARVTIQSNKTPTNQIDAPLRKASDGTWYVEMPEKYTSTGTPNIQNGDHELKFEITDSSGALLRECDVKIKVAIPLKKPDKVGIIKGFDIKHLAEEAKSTGKDQKYTIGGHSHDFIIKKKSWGREYVAQVPDEHNLLGHGHGIPPVIDGTPKENIVTAKNPEELAKKIYERLHHINHHKEIDFNVANGILEEEKSHQEGHDEKKEKGESHEKSEGKEKADKEGHEKKGDHKEGHEKHPEEGGTKYDKVVNTIFGNGLIGKGFKGIRNIIPKGIRGLSGAAFDGAVASTVVGGGIYLAGVALGSAAIGTLVVPAMTTAFAVGGTVSAVKRFNKWRANRGGGESKGGGHGGGH